jgi:hypothetical protein
MTRLEAILDPKRYVDAGRSGIDLERLSRIVYLVISAAFCLILASRPIPWASDDWNYMGWADRALRTLDLLQDTDDVLLWLIEEPVFNLLSIALYLMFDDEMTVRVIIFISSATLFWGLRNILRNRWFFLSLFAVAPWIVDLYFLHLRQGLAVSVMILALGLSGTRRHAVFILGGLVHTSVLVMWPVLVYAEIARDRFRLKDWQVIALFTCALVLLAVVMSPQLGNWTGWEESSRSYLADEGVARRNLTYILIPLGFGIVAYLCSKRVDIFLMQYILGILLNAFLLFDVTSASRIYTNYLILFAVHLGVAEYRLREKCLLYGTYFAYAVYTALIEHPYLT